MELKEVNINNLEEITAILFNAEVQRMSGDAPTLNEIETSLKEEGSYGIYVPEQEKAVGYFKLGINTCYFSFHLLPEYWNKGFFSQCLDKLLKANYNSIISAKVLKSNKACRHVLEKKGFEEDIHAFDENSRYTLYNYPV